MISLNRFNPVFAIEGPVQNTPNFVPDLWLPQTALQIRHTQGLLLQMLLQTERSHILAP